MAFWVPTLPLDCMDLTLHAPPHTVCLALVVCPASLVRAV